MIPSCACGCGSPVPLAQTHNRVRGWVKGAPLRFVHGHNARGRRGPAHPSWRGDEAGYSAVHRWLRRYKERTGLCEHCGDRPASFDGKSAGTDFANVSGEYRRDVDDYIELCRACHLTFDGRTTTALTRGG